MADTSYWAELLNSPVGADLRTRGAIALATGQVSEEEAQAAVSPLLKAAGLGKGKKNPVLAAARRQAAMPSVGAGMELPDLSVSPVARGSGMTNEEQVKGTDSAAQTSSNKDVAQQLQFMSPEQLNDLYSSTSRLPAFQDQEEGIRLNQDLLKIASQAPTDVFSGPLAGLLQAEFGRNTGTMAQMRGQSPADQRNGILSMVGKIQDDKRDLSKGIFEAIGKQRAGYTMTTIADQLALKSIIDQMNRTKAEDPKKFEKTGRAGPNLNTLVEKHQKRMADLEGTRVTMNVLDELIGGMDNWKGQDIPGVGATGRFPSLMLTDKGKDIQQTYSDLKNQVLNMRSGKQINEQEYRRLSNALGSGLTGDDHTFVNALKRFRKELESVMRQREAAVKGTAVGPEVLRQYKAGGGTLSEDAFPKTAPPPATKAMSFEEWKKAGKPKAGQ